MKVTSVFATVTFKLILEFDCSEYRLLDIKQFLQNDKGKFAEVRDDIDMFQTATVDRIAGTVMFGNGVDFEPEQLYSESVNVDYILGEKIQRSE